MVSVPDLAEPRSFETGLAHLKTPEIHGWNIWSKQANARVHIVPEGIAFTSTDFSAAIGVGAALGLPAFLAALKGVKPAQLILDPARCEGFHDDIARVIAIRQDGGRWLVLSPNIRHWFVSSVSTMPEKTYEGILSSFKSRMGDRLLPKPLVNRGRIVKEFCIFYGAIIAAIFVFLWAIGGFR